MKKDNELKSTTEKLKPYYGLIFIAAAIALNIAANRFVTALNLPLYLDCIGMIVVSAIGGLVPGVIVGFLSNIINSIGNLENAYYTVTSVLIAGAAYYYAKHGYYKSLPKALLTAFPLCLIGGGTGLILTFALSGLGYYDMVDTGLRSVFNVHESFRTFLSTIPKTMLYDFIDKLITVFLAWLIIKALPEKLKTLLYLPGWHQRPLPENEIYSTENVISTHRSLRVKIQGLVAFAILFVAGASITISLALYRQASIREHTDLGRGVAKLVASVIDGDRVEEYIRDGFSAPGYDRTRKELESIREASHDILFIYVYRIQEDGCHVVFDLDTEDTPAGLPGEIVEFDEAFSPYLPSLLKGDTIEPVVSDETFGWLLTAYEPVRNSQGITTAYACVDISMMEVVAQMVSFLAKVVSLFLGFFLMIIAIGMWIAEYNLILPINSMAIAANRFAYNSEAAREDSVQKFRDLEISTGDEIENLYDSFSMTIEETVQYIADIHKKSGEISRMQNGLILVLADMVESRDKCTGDHVRKTAMYCRIILEQLKKDGVYLDQLTDEFVRDVINSAPLHDVGKIKVSDAILNKPGKLTDEEFEIMKSHTTAGKEIIESAMKLVSTSSGYLAEAKNLAAYHHEKWNGKGYPEGLAGEQIPLSARVMAVADVFDALVSVRSYKKPFSFEQACDIIRKDAGTHFDPHVANAFLEVKEEARRIAEENLGGSLPGEYQKDEKA